MRETILTRRILRALNAYPDCKAIKAKGLEVGTPDIFGCYQGQAFLLEVKTTSTVSKAQQQRLSQWRATGATCAVAREDFSVREFIESLDS